VKRLFKKKEGLVRGVPSAVLLSALIHFILLSLAGGLIVFSVIKRPEKVFIPPPPAERPKTPLIKPRVKMKKNVKPGATRRIVSKQILGMPDMQLPTIEGMGQGLGGGVGGFELMPDSSGMTLFGGAKSMASGNDFEGTFYSLRYSRLREVVNDTKDQIYPIIRRFLELNWNPRVFAPYFQSSRKLYATQFLVPAVITSEGPRQFGIERDADFDPIIWFVHYKGRIASKEGGRFRFWGMGDFLFVRLNGKLVFVGTGRPQMDSCDWPEYLNEEEKAEYNLCSEQARVGLWFDLESGVPVDMEVLTGEGDGGYFTCMLLVEKEGEYYVKNREGMPVLPAFRTAEIPESIKSQIEYKLIPGEVDLESELMFNVY
jgi:hypothetical protein